MNARDLRVVDELLDQSCANAAGTADDNNAKIIAKTLNSHLVSPFMSNIHVLYVPNDIGVTIHLYNCGSDFPDLSLGYGIL